MTSDIIYISAIAFLGVIAVLATISCAEHRNLVGTLQELNLRYKTQMEDKSASLIAAHTDCRRTKAEVVALTGDREVLRQQLAISEDTVAMLRAEVDKMRVVEQTRADQQAEFDAMKKQLDCLREEVRFTKEQRDKHESARLSLAEQRNRLLAEVESLKDKSERIAGSNAFLVRECERMDTQLTAIRNAMATGPEPEAE